MTKCGRLVQRFNSLLGSPLEGASISSDVRSTCRRTNYSTQLARVNALLLVETTGFS